MTHEPTQTDITSQSLLARVRRHAPGSWERMSSVYGPLVYQWARRCGLRAEDAADVVQDVFAVLSRRIQDYRGSGRFRGWLWVMTRNKVRDLIRKSHDQAVAAGGSTAHRHLQQLPDDAPEPGLVDAETSGVSVSATASSTGNSSRSVAEFGVAARTVEMVRAEFEASTWKAFWSATVERRTAADIGAALGMTKHAVHQAKYRVLRRLREELDELGGLS